MTPYEKNIVAAFRMHVSPAKYIAMRAYQEGVTTGQTDRQTDRQTPDEMIPVCRYASKAR